MATRPSTTLLAVTAVTAGLLLTTVPTATAQDSGETLTIGVIQDLSSPNVTQGYLVPDYEVWNLQYATLTDKAADDFEVVPGLAESWTSTDDEGTAYRYTLREGLQWSDGTPLTASDVASTINRSRDEEWANHYSTVANLTATAVDERTVDIVSSVPDPKLPGLDVYVVPEHVYGEISADGLADHDGLDGVGSGPYRITEWRSGQDWTMERNPNWFGEYNGIDRIVFRVFSNVDAMVAALQRGEIDAASGFTGDALNQLEGADDIEVVAGLQGGFTELGLNGYAGGIGDGHPALRDITVRHAIYHAIDREVLFERVALGYGAVGTTLSPSVDPTWVPDLGDENFDFDPDRSRQLLDDAGYVDTDGDGVREMPDGGQPLRFRYAERSESSVAAPIREFITDWLDDIGIATEVSVYDDSQLYEIQIAGDYDMFVWGWTPFVDPDTLLSFFTCAEVNFSSDDGGSNDANWCDPTYDELYERQKVELDPEARREIVTEMLRYFNTNATFLVLLMDADLQAYRTDRFEGWTRQPAETGPVLFSNSSPTYANLRIVGSGGGSSSGTLALAAGLVALVVIGGGVILAVRRRASADERE